MKNKQKMEKKKWSLFKSRKAQFFILSVFAIVTTLYFLSRWLEPNTVIDTSSVALREEAFVFNNIKEKTFDVLTSSKNCEELNFNLQEYKQAAEDYALSKNYLLDFNYAYPSCVSGMNIDFTMILTSTNMQLASNFSVRWPPEVPTCGPDGTDCGTCVVCSAGTCSGYYGAGTIDSTLPGLCNAPHYRCDGLGSCTAPITESWVTVSCSWVANWETNCINSGYEGSSGYWGMHWVGTCGCSSTDGLNSAMECTPDPCCCDFQSFTYTWNELCEQQGGTSCAVVHVYCWDYVYD